MLLKILLNFQSRIILKFIHISSTSVYGSQDKIIGENCRELKPQSPYADVKLLEEKYLKKTKNISYFLEIWYNCGFLLTE